MMKFIEKPNLPEGMVSRILCGNMPEVVEKFLIQRNTQIIKCEPNLHIDSAVKYHADMCAVHLGGNKIIVGKNQTSLIKNLREWGLSVCETRDIIAGEYPFDVKLNVALFGSIAVGAFIYSDNSLLEAIEGLSKYNVRQGYAKCSILPITEKALITDDPSICNALKNSFDVLLVQKGDIVLEGHEYGFIGGAAAKISKDEILFFGNLRKHRNCDDILAFLGKYSCKAIFFETIPLTDVGGIVSLSEYI